MQTLYAYMNGHAVAKISQAEDGAHELKYFTTWIEHPKARPLSNSLALDYKAIRSRAVYTYLENILPDSPQIREALSQAFKSPSTMPVDILRFIGRDTQNSVAFLPNKISHTHAQLEANETPLARAPLSKEDLGEMLNVSSTSMHQSFQPRLQRRAILGMNCEHSDRLKADFRICLSGTQNQTSLFREQNQWQLPLMQRGATHIIKGPSGELHCPNANLSLNGITENEWLCTQLAQALDFTVLPCELLTINGEKCLVTERADRRLNSAQDGILQLPSEDLCQALNVSSGRKYQQDGGPGIVDTMHLLMGSKNAMADRDAFMRMQVFLWLIGASCAHAKQYRLFIEKAGAYRLAPFSNLISSYSSLGKDGLTSKSISLAMGYGSAQAPKFKQCDICRDDFLNMAKQTGFDVMRMRSILDEFCVAMPEAIESLKRRISSQTLAPHISSAIFSNTQAQVHRLKHGR